MKRSVVLFFLSLVVALPAQAGSACNTRTGCDEAAAAAKRSVRQQSGGPDSSLRCVYLTTPDPCDSVVVASIDTSGAVTTIEELARGAAVNFAQKSPFKFDAQGNQIVQCAGSEKAMVCIHPDRVTDATDKLRLIPGNGGTCHQLTREMIDDLLANGSWGPERALRIGWSSVGAQTAPRKR